MFARKRRPGGRAAQGAVATTDFRDAPSGLLLVAPPRAATCTVRRRSSRPSSRRGTEVGEDADFFYFPSLRGRGSRQSGSGAAGTLMAIHRSLGRHHGPFQNGVSSRRRSPMRSWMAQGGFLTPHSGVKPRTPTPPGSRPGRARSLLKRHHLPLRCVVYTRFYPRPDAGRESARGHVLDRHGRLCRRVPTPWTWRRRSRKAGTRFKIS